MSFSVKSSEAFCSKDETWTEWVTRDGSQKGIYIYDGYVVGEERAPIYNEDGTRVQASDTIIAGHSYSTTAASQITFTFDGRTFSAANGSWQDLAALDNEFRISGDYVYYSDFYVCYENGTRVEASSEIIARVCLYSKSSLLIKRKQINKMQVGTCKWGRVSIACKWGRVSIACKLKKNW